MGPFGVRQSRPRAAARGRELSVARAMVGAMPRVVLDEIDLGSVEDAVGATAFDAGYREMHDGVVRRMEWVPSRRALRGIVQDKGGEFHETVAYFSGGSPMRLSRWPGRSSLARISVLRDRARVPGTSRSAR
jgi:hypothetical protein